ncbi:MAG: hypothetical protein EZS28_030428, partial [Streblomastix strix]
GRLQFPSQSNYSLQQQDTTEASPTETIKTKTTKDLAKALAFYETMEVRWGQMLVIETETCKTTCLRAQSDGLYNIHEGVSEGKTE